jgi:MFS family permease
MSDQVKPLSRGRVYYSFVVLYLLFMVDFMSRVGVNSLFPVIQEDLGLTDSQVGMLGSVVLVGMAVFVLPISYIADRVSRKKTVIVLSIIWGLGTLISATADDYTTLLITRFFVGLGNSGYAAVSVSMISGWFSEAQRGKALSLYDTAMDLGVAVASAVCGILAGLMGWQATLAFVGVLSLLISVLSFFVPEERKQAERLAAQKKNNEKSKVDLKSAAKAVLQNKPLLAVSLGAGFNNFLYSATIGWMSMFMVRNMDYSISVAGTIVGAVSLVGLIGYPIGGYIIDKWYQTDVRSRAWMGGLSGIFSGLCNGLAVYLQCVPLFFLGYIVVTIATAAPHIATQELVEERFRAVSYGLYVVFIQAMGAVGPTLVGVISEASNLSFALASIQVFGLLAGLFYAIAGKLYIPTYNKVKKLEEQNEKTA